MSTPVPQHLLTLSQFLNELYFEFKCVQNFCLNGLSLDALLINLYRLYEHAHSTRKNLISLQQEELANFVLAHQFTLKALISVIRSLKEFNYGDLHLGWEHVISAEYFLDDSFSAFPKIANYLTFCGDLCLQVSLLQDMFPPQSFVSPGLVAEKMLCSLCNISVEECKVHRDGYPYNGNLCKHLCSKIWEGNHIAHVANPKDKRSRIFAVKDPKTEKWLNWMTLEEDDSLIKNYLKDGLKSDDANAVINLCLEKAQIMQDYLDQPFDTASARMILLSAALDNDLIESFFEKRKSRNEMELKHFKFKESLYTSIVSLEFGRLLARQQGLVSLHRLCGLINKTLL